MLYASARRDFAVLGGNALQCLAGILLSVVEVPAELVIHLEADGGAEDPRQAQHAAGRHIPYNASCLIVVSWHA